MAHAPNETFVGEFTEAVSCFERLIQLAESSPEELSGVSRETLESYIRSIHNQLLTLLVLEGFKVGLKRMEKGLEESKKLVTELKELMENEQRFNKMAASEFVRSSVADILRIQRQLANPSSSFSPDDVTHPSASATSSRIVIPHRSIVDSAYDRLSSGSQHIVA